MTMAAVTKVLVFSLLYMVKGVYPQAQPCLVCGDAVLRIWSLMSRQGDHYLRITNTKSNGGDDDDDDDDGAGRTRYVVDFQGDTNNDNFTSLLKIRERSTFRETRIQFIFIQDGKEYHLYTPTATGPLLAMPANEGLRATDHRNTFAPERLLYEHRLFTVFQSVKYRGYYLSSDGSGKTFLQSIINKAYRDPSHLFLTIDPGNAIRGATFGAGIAIGRKKRAIKGKSDPGHYKKPYYPHGYAPYHRPFYPRYRKKPAMKKKCVPPPLPTTPKPGVLGKTTLAPVKTTTRPFRARKHSSISVKTDLPEKITFVICFWIKTIASKAQLISLVEHGKNMKSEFRWKYWKRTYWKKSYYWPKYKKPVDHNIFNVTLYKGKLRVEVGYDRVISEITKSNVNDGKFHHICFSLNEIYTLDVYQDSRVVLTKPLRSVSCDLSKKSPSTKRHGTLALGRHRGMVGEDFIGSLFQVNLWDQYPSFRIQRIATNCACGGGNLVRWEDILNGTMSSVDLDHDRGCPKLEGYNYDEITQNHLI